MGYGNRAYGTTTYGDGIGGTYVTPPNTNTTRQDAVWQVDENIGFFVSISKDGVWQADENIGLEKPGKAAVLFWFLRRRD